MDLSTNELYHFTEFQFLKLILKDLSFIPRYNFEFTVLSHNHNRRASLFPIPMVCFCDIPLEMSKKHRDRYGHCGIALNEDWKFNSGLNPIIYVKEDSIMANILADLMNKPDEFISLINDYPKDIRIPLTLSSITDNLKHLSYFLKRFENKKEIHISYAGKVRAFEKRKFYDEREWRFIPFSAESNGDLFLHISNYDNLEKRNSANECMKKYPLHFEYKDILALIVENQSQKEELMNILDSNNASKEIEIKILNEEGSTVNKKDSSFGS